MTDRAFELGYDLAEAEHLVRDRAEFQRRCQFYADYVVRRGTPVGFEIYRAASDRGLECCTVTVSATSSQRVHVRGGPLRHLPDGATDVFPGLSATLLDAMIDVVVVTDATPNGRPGPLVLYCNAAFETMTGYARHEIIAKTPRILQGPDTSDEVRGKISRGLRAWANISAELVNYKKDGTPFRVSLNISPVADETGWYTHWISIQRDITLERRREEMQAVANRVEVATTVASGIAHDLNNGLAVTASQLESLGENLSAEPRRELDRIVDSMVEMQGITRQFVALNRDGKRSGTSVLACEVQRAVSVLPRRVKEAVSVRVGNCENICVTLSGEEVGQIVLNLVLNAQQAATQARVLPDIRIALEPRSLEDGRAGVSLVVTDNGPGVAPELCEQIFSPYVTTKESGSGLGLYNVARIAREHGGTALLRDSSVGDGATFEITFPIVEGTPALGLDPARAESTEEKRGHLLIVEDQEVLAMRWSTTLGRYFERVDVRHTVAGGLQALEALLPDCLLCDMNLDLQEGGIEVVKDFLERSPGGCYLITTGSPERVPDWVPKEAILEKPFRSARLIERVRLKRLPK